VNDSKFSEGSQGQKLERSLQDKINLSLSDQQIHLLSRALNHYQSFVEQESAKFDSQEHVFQSYLKVIKLMVHTRNDMVAAVKRARYEKASLSERNQMKKTAEVRRDLLWNQIVSDLYHP
jgi:hypothetical protein